MRQQYKTVLLWVVLIVMFVSFWKLFHDTAPDIRETEYSEYIARVDANEIESVVVKGGANAAVHTYRMKGDKADYRTAGPLSEKLLEKLQVAGIKMINIGYKGQPPAIPDLLNGALHFKIVALGLAAPHVKSGKIKALATFTHERVKALPEVPTIAEAGFPEVALVPWYGAYVRAGTPKEIVERINAEINKALQSPEVADRLLKSGSLPGSVKSADEIQAMMRADYERWGKVVRAAGIKAQ